jgi:hypothetical protein
MNIKVIKCIETGEYLESYYEEYPFTGWSYHTKDLSKAMVFRNTFHLIDVLKMLKKRSRFNYISTTEEFTNYEN